MKNKFWAVLLFLFWAPLAFAASPAQIYIAQVQTTGGPGKTDQDFVELFNPGSTPVNLKGYRLVKRSQSSQSDTLIKSWSSDSLIPPKSFYLWANSSYLGIAVKPDVVTSGTLSDDSGVALRFGANDTGQVIDSLAWGKANNTFNVGTAINPGAGQAIFRQDWYAVTTTYFIASPKPYNTQTTDFTAAYRQSQALAATQGQSGQTTQIQSQKTSQTASAAPSQTQFSTTLAPLAVASVSETPTPSYANVNSYQNNTKASSPWNYLILAGGALLALIFLAWKFFFTKGK